MGGEEAETLNTETISEFWLWRGGERQSSNWVRMWESRKHLFFLRWKRLMYV